ncbi:MAG: PIN domain-containing protein [Armatimonadota bacterium]|nr:PIN domain-containing protein [Armatimonadota bacterium]
MRTVYVLDSNTVSYIIERDAAVAARMAEAVAERALLYLCPVVYFEVSRGFLHRQNRPKERAFRALMQQMQWAEMDRADWNVAAHMWADCAGRGAIPSDADVLIAAFALNRGASVVTSNVKHFDALPVPLEDWRE